METMMYSFNFEEKHKTKTKLPCIKLHTEMKRPNWEYRCETFILYIESFIISITQRLFSAHVSKQDALESHQSAMNRKYACIALHRIRISICLTHTSHGTMGIRDLVLTVQAQCRYVICFMFLWDHREGK